MSGFPLLLIPLAVCNIISFLMPGVSYTAALFTLPLPSGAAWTVTLSDGLIALGLLLLLLEVVKSARPGGKYVTDHLLALVIFVGAAAVVLLPPFANATFFLLTLIALVDFFGGIGLRGRRSRRVREAIVAVEPAPEPAVAREPALPVSPMPRGITSEPALAEPELEVPPARIEAVTRPRVEPIIESRPPPTATDQPSRPPSPDLP